MQHISFKVVAATRTVEPKLKFHSPAPTPAPGIKIFDSASNIYTFLAPTPNPERVEPLKTKNHCIICTTLLPHINCIYKIGTQISGSGSGSTI